MDGPSNISPPSHPSETGLHHGGRLACQACQRKKIKCDRNYPCGQCLRSSLHCAPSTRKPRTRHAGKRAVDTELRSRISKLESLVESLSGDAGAEEIDAADASPETTSEQPQGSCASVSKYIGSSFWSSLTTEVQALRDALEDEPDDADDEPVSPSTSASTPGNLIEYDLVLYPPGMIYVMPGALAEPSPQLAVTLWDLFVSNADAIFKLFHGPTLRPMICDNGSYLGQEASAPCNRALKAVVWFSAVNTLTDEQCNKLFGVSRMKQMAQYRRNADVALAQADIINTTDLAALQAFLAYIPAARNLDTGRRTWTLLAVALRVSRAMGLHSESLNRSPFERELRKRAWYSVLLLDVFTSMDRGTELLIDPQTYDTSLPSNVNDAEFDESSTEIPNHEGGLTDMSGSLLGYDACYFLFRITKPERDSKGETWQQRFELAQKFARLVSHKYMQYCDPSDPYQRLLRSLARSITTNMRLRAVRPVNKHVSSQLPPIESPFVLKLAIESLKASESFTQDPYIQSWRSMVWVQWHPLAVAIAALCCNRDNPLANEAWPLVERAYEGKAPQHIADTKTGMLWRPIEKLYKKAVAFRDHGEDAYHRASQPGRFGSRSKSTQPKSSTISSNATYQPHPSAPPSMPTSASPPNFTSQDGFFNHNGIQHGAMPFTSVPMDFDPGLNFIDATATATAHDESDNTDPAGPMSTTSSDAVRNGDLSWLEFERILEDVVSTSNTAAAAGGAPAGFGAFPDGSFGDFDLNGGGVGSSQPWEMQMQPDMEAVDKDWTYLMQPSSM